MDIVGTVLDGRYFIRKLLGSGNFGAVFLAEQRIFGLPQRQVALKLFHRQMVTAENAASMLNDAVMLMRLQGEPTHAGMAPHLVSVLDAGFLREDATQAYVAMEYVPGYPTPGGSAIPTLQGLIRAYRPVPVALGLRWMAEILKPLAWMHTLDPPVLHCDLKPDNILADGRDRLKIADFGLAQLAIGAIGTALGAGAITCQAPETLTQTAPTTAADVYSIGLLFHEIFAGRNPLADVGVNALAVGWHAGHIRKQIQARYNGLPDLSAADHPELRDHPLLCDIAARCLRFKASDRYDNAALVLRELEVYGEVTLDRLLAEADSLTRADRVDDAIARCAEARHRYPQSPRPFRKLAEIHKEQRDWENVKDVCGEGLKAFTGDAELMWLAADAYDATGESGLAAALRRKR